MVVPIVPFPKRHENFVHSGQKPWKGKLPPVESHGGGTPVAGHRTHGAPAMKLDRANRPAMDTAAPGRPKQTHSEWLLLDVKHGMSNSADWEFIGIDAELKYGIKLL